VSEPSKFSAQVVVKPHYLKDANRITAAFRQAGYECGPLVGNNFSSTGPAGHFGGAMQGVAVSAAPSADAVLKRLDEKTQAMIESVVFPSPPDFGPWGGH